MAARVRGRARFHVFNPGAIDTQRHFVFAFAGGGAGVAANALPVVNDKSVVFSGAASGERSIFCHNTLPETCSETIGVFKILVKGGQ